MSTLRNERNIKGLNVYEYTEIIRKEILELRDAKNPSYADVEELVTHLEEEASYAVDMLNQVAEGLEVLWDRKIPTAQIVESDLYQCVQTFGQAPGALKKNINALDNLFQKSTAGESQAMKLDVS